MTASPSPSPRRPLPLRAAGFLLFLAYFLRALIVANLQLARTILLVKREDLAPGFLDYPVQGLSKLEILVLSHLITLTPGTTTVEVSADFTRLVLHALDARSPEATREEIRATLQTPILWWTR